MSSQHGVQLFVKTNRSEHPPSGSAWSGDNCCKNKMWLYLRTSPTINPFTYFTLYWIYACEDYLILIINCVPVQISCYSYGDYPPEVVIFVCEDLSAQILKEMEDLKYDLIVNFHKNGQLYPEGYTKSEKQNLRRLCAKFILQGTYASSLSLSPSTIGGQSSVPIFSMEFCYTAVPIATDGLT